MINYLALFTAIGISFVAAYYSIIGLTAIFAGAFWPVVIMGSFLELAKLVTASWLYRNWTTVPKLIKYYLTTSVVVLMFITSMGIFGFLSKAHIEQTTISSDQTVVIQNIELQIDQENRRIKNAQRALDSLNAIVEQSNAKDANFIRTKQKKERDGLNGEIDQASKTIQQLNEKLVPLKKENAKIIAEVGPIKYIADLIYGEGAQQHLEAAVRWVIIILVLVFDPLAVLLLVAANISLVRPSQDSNTTSQPPKSSATRQKRDPLWVSKTKQLKEKKKAGIIEIDEKSIMEMK